MGQYYRPVNYTKKEFVDLKTIRSISRYDKNWKIHPLPLLTCEGNGRGGGDFYEDDKRIGSWARDSISIEVDKPIGFLLVDGTFIED